MKDNDTLAEAEAVQEYFKSLTLVEAVQEAFKPLITRIECMINHRLNMSQNFDSEYLKTCYKEQATGMKLVLNELKQELKIPTDKSDG